MMRTLSSSPIIPILANPENEGLTFLISSFCISFLFEILLKAIFANECPDCWAGHVCDKTGMSNADKASTRKCAAGYYCDSGAATAIDGQDCPLGYFCLEGIENLDDSECPIGTYNDLTGLQSADQCKPCTAGYYCDAAGLTAVNTANQCEVRVSEVKSVFFRLFSRSKYALKSSKKLSQYLF